MQDRTPLRMLAAKVGGQIIPTTVSERDAVVIARAMEAGHSIRSVQIVVVEVREVPNA